MSESETLKEQLIRAAKESESMPDCREEWQEIADRYRKAGEPIPPRLMPRGGWCGFDKAQATYLCGMAQDCTEPDAFADEVQGFLNEMEET
jgi:hypothetical protein